MFYPDRSFWRGDIALSNWRRSTKESVDSRIGLEATCVMNDLEEF